MFIDELTLEFKAGDGGPGTVSFRKEKYIPFGGPDGGNGGDGGRIIVRADPRLESLSHLVRIGMLKAENGRPGEGGKRHGRNGADFLVMVPVGTTVEKKGEEPIEMGVSGKTVMAGRGGRGGMGNAAFASATNRTPRIAQKGEVGEEGKLHLELSLAVDVAIIGMPNSGKSMLLNRLTGANARIAAYPFTTTEVTKGVYERAGKTYLVIETPGVVEGSSTGKGLGAGFLRHLKKAKAIIHLVDGTSLDVANDVETVDRELTQYDWSLAEKPQVVAVNKLDVADVRNSLDKTKSDLAARRRPVHFISALTGEGLETLMDTVLKMVTQQQPAKSEAEAAPVIHLLSEEKEQNVVYRKRGVVVIEAPELEEVLKRTDILNQDAQSYMKKQFVRTGVARLLKKEGVKVGDRVRCGEVEWDWQWPL